MAPRIALLLLVCLGACASSCFCRPVLLAGQQASRFSQAAAAAVTPSSSAGRALLGQTGLFPQGFGGLFRRPNTAAASIPPDAADPSVPPPVTLPADLQLESAPQLDFTSEPGQFAGLFKRAAGRGGFGDPAQADAAGQQLASSGDILESGQMQQKFQAEGKPVLKDGSAAAASSSQDAGGQAPVSEPASPLAADASTGSSSGNAADASAAGPVQGQSTPSQQQDNGDVALIPTDPYASATAIPVVPYTGGVKNNDALVQAFMNRAGGGLRDRGARIPEAGQQGSSGKSGKLSGGAIAGLVIGVLAGVGFVAGLVVLRSRMDKSKGANKKPVRALPSTDAEVDVSEIEMLSPAASRASGSSAFQPARPVGRYSNSSGPGSSRMSQGA